MKHFCHIIVASTAFALCINWSSQETSVDGRTKQSINFKGIITPQQGSSINVENISIGRMYKQIPVYEAPQLQENEETTRSGTHSLSKDPKEGIITRIDLSEISQIVVPDPDTLWSYQKKQHNRKVDYIVIAVISNDTAKTRHSYLIEVDRKITCDEINEAGPIEKDIPLPAIKSLTIHCFMQREEEPEKNKLCKSSQSCPVCPATTPAPTTEVIIQETKVQ